MNPFAVLDLPERANLSSEEITQRFHLLSARHHPDRQGDQAQGDRERFTEINQAYQKLRFTGTRLRSLLELRCPDTFALKGSLPDALIDLFSELGPVLQEADAFLAKKENAQTNLSQALLAPELLRVQQSLSRVASRVQGRLDAVEARLSEIDSLLDSSPPTKEALPLASLICREALYLEKWRAQIQERFHRLI